MAVYEQRYPQRQPITRQPITRRVPAPQPMPVYDEINDYWVEDEGLWSGEYTHYGMHPIQQRMMVILAFVVVGTLLFAGLAAPRIRGTNGANNGSENHVAANTADVTTNPGGGIAPLFTREVQHWTPQILAWAAEHGLDPNMVATVMQIESCGDPAALSIAGAQGLFQVMPFHFQPGENAFDPNTNALRGMSFLATLITQFGESGLAFAGYNGGPGNAVKSYENWPAETQRYYYWATGIYEDAVAGRAESARLNEWLAAGGAGGCARAAASLGLR